MVPYRKHLRTCSNCNGRLWFAGIYQSQYKATRSQRGQSVTCSALEFLQLLENLFLSMPLFALSIYTDYTGYTQVVNDKIKKIRRFRPIACGFPDPKNTKKRKAHFWAFLCDFSRIVLLFFVNILAFFGSRLTIAKHF